MQDHGLIAWLGTAAGDLTPEQLERIAAEARRIAERWSDPDEQPERDAALAAVVQHLLGETSPEDAGRALLDARRREREAYAAAETIAGMLVGGGSPKATAARRVGRKRGGSGTTAGPRARRHID